MVDVKLNIWTKCDMSWGGAEYLFMSSRTGKFGDNWGEPSRLRRHKCEEGKGKSWVKVWTGRVWQCLDIS